ncbi:MAG TPA: hypothetical protein VKA49_09425 [Flavitalea sp.]|nr:hypothetical protein [Flavitalea sp.]
MINRRYLLAFLTISLFTLASNWDQKEKTVMKKFSLMMAALTFSIMSFSQTIKGNIEKLAKDPKTSENAAKADVYILENRKVVSDTSVTPTVRSNAIIKTSRKKKQSRKS